VTDGSVIRLRYVGDTGWFLTGKGRIEEAAGA
jgi:hypothetical protein